MKRMILIIYLLSVALCFEIVSDFPKVVEGTDELHLPFSGGFDRPRIHWNDWDSDGDADLFVLDDDGYIRYFRNDGDNLHHNYNLVTTAFGAVNCGAWFFMHDFDSDGDNDLVAQDVIQENRMIYYSNESGEFVEVGNVLTSTGEYMESFYSMVPTFADIDNDGDYDFFSPDPVGTLNYYECGGMDNGIPIFTFISNFWQGIAIGFPTQIQRHGAAAIAFVDLDSDGDLDLSWGDYFQPSLYIVWNNGTATDPLMDTSNIISQYPGPDGNEINSAGQNMPSFLDIDSDGDFDLFITVLSGAYGNQYVNNFYYYRNDGSSSYPDYSLIDQNFIEGIDVLSDSSPDLVDIDGDGDLDLFISNKYVDTSVPWNGRIRFYRNTGTSTNPIWSLEDDEFLGQDIGVSLSIEFDDIDSDGDFDLFVGDYNGKVLVYTNIGNPEDFMFSEGTFISGIDLSGNLDPSFYDYDGDGDKDMITGELNGSVKLYYNIGDSQNFELDTKPENVLNLENFSQESYTSPEFFDIDGNGYLDLVLGTGTQGIFIYYNSSEGFSQTPEHQSFIYGSILKPEPYRLYGDSGKSLMLVGNKRGGLFSFCTYDSFGVCGGCDANGDINGDMILNVLDVVQMISGITNNNFTDSQKCKSDINLDGVVDILDVVVIINIITSRK